MEEPAIGVGSWLVYDIFTAAVAAGCATHIIREKRWRSGLIEVNRRLQREKQINLGREVAAYFTRKPEINFMGFAGVGRHGGALILEERSPSGRVLLKIVVKYSHGQFSTDPYSDADADLRNEHSWLEMLRGTEHIVQLAPFKDCSPWAPGISRGGDTYEAAVDQAILEAEARGGWVPKPRRCPTFALEYLPNGTLSDFVERIRQARQFVPNRLQWRIWLCLVRQCVAMAFPPKIPFDEYIPGTKRREVIPRNKEYYELTQNSAHLKNWMWGEVQPSADMEHYPGIPIIKLIDFGRGRLENPDQYPELGNPSECGSRINLFNAAYVMREISCPLDEYRDLQLSGNPQPYLYTKNGQVFSVETNAPGPFRSSQMMDVELRDILVRCLADKLQDVPSLEEVLELTEAAVANRRRNQNPELSERMRVYEEDGYIRWMIQEYVFDAR